MSTIIVPLLLAILFVNATCKPVGSKTSPEMRNARQELQDKATKSRLESHILDIKPKIEQVLKDFKLWKKKQDKCEVNKPKGTRTLNDSTLDMIRDSLNSVKNGKDYGSAQKSLQNISIELGQIRNVFKDLSNSKSLNEKIQLSVEGENLTSHCLKIKTSMRRALKRARMYSLLEILNKLQTTVSEDQKALN